MTDSIVTSALLHLGLLGCFALFALISEKRLPAPRTFKISVQEAPNLRPAPIEEPVIQLSAQPKPVSAKPVEPVFGISNSTQVDAGSSVSIKAGNTLAKEIDQKPADNTDSLPVPAAEFLVTKMPRLRAEIRIPYPAEARAQNIEGVVVMNILIDEAGKVREATLVEGPGSGLNEAALEAIVKFQFDPAEIDQKPVAVRIRYAYRFILN